MKRPFFYNDQYVFSDDLNFISSSLEEELTNRFQSLLTSSRGYNENDLTNTGSVDKGGVFGSPEDYAQLKNLNVVKVNADELIIYQGAALDINGELIQVLSNVSVYLSQSSTTFSWLGSPNVLNYVKIKYIEVGSSLQTDDGGNSHYTKYTPSYFITIDDTIPTGEEILLATFVANASGEVLGSLTDRRLYVSVVVPSSSVILDPLTKPVSTWRSVADHVNAIGTGIPSDTNPHGLAGIDLGTDATGHQFMGRGTLNGTKYDIGAYEYGYLP